MATVKLRLKDAMSGSVDLPTNDAHRIVVTRPRVFVLDVEDAHFNLDRRVLLPELSAVDGSPPVLDARRVTGLGVIVAALTHAKKNPAQRLFVTGHTDASGAAGYNQTLSEERAQNVSLLLRGRREEWKNLSAAHDAVDDYQTVLAWQHQRAGWGCDPGPINGKPSKRSRAAIRAFQERYNAEVDEALAAGRDTPFKKKIGVDETVGPETWGAFYDVYMSELMELLDLPSFGALAQMQARLQAPPGMKDFVGCGEHIPFNPARRKPFDEGKDEHLEGPQRNPADRRVEILFFDPGEEVGLACHESKGACNPSACEVYVKVPPRQVPIGIPKGLEVAEVNLRLTFVDPEGKVRPFPEGLPVQAKFDAPEEPTPSTATDDALAIVDLDEEAEPQAAPADDTAAAPADEPESLDVEQEPTAVVGPDGSLRFAIARRARTLHLRVLAGAEKTFVTADPKNLADQKLATNDEALEAVGKGRVFFRLPAALDTQRGYFELPEPAGVSFEDGLFRDVDNRQTQIGSREKPLELRLAIRWQHFELEYFDRWTSSVAHVGQARAPEGQSPTAPPLVLEGIAKLVEGDLMVVATDACSAWDVMAGKDAVHCLAWVSRQITADQPRRDLPDDKCTVRFRTERVFVRTEGDGSSPEAVRKLVQVDPADEALQPSADRLRLYDLPAEWRSRLYPARVAGEGVDKSRPFEQVAAKPSAFDKPYVVSLDVIVLQGKDLAGADTAAVWDDSKLANRFTILDNKLEVYKADPPSGEPYFTRLASLKPPPTGPVLVDVPPFTRLITRGPVVFDVFGARTERGSKASGVPIGARLAQRMEGGTVVFRHTLAEAPFLTQRPNSTNGPPTDLGDSFSAILRCCGHEKGVELFAVLQYASVTFDFAPVIDDALKSKFSNLKTAVPLTTVPADAVTRARDCLVKVAARWNGRDGINPSATTFEVDGPVKARGRYMALLTRADRKAPAPLNKGDVRINIFKEGRSFMAGGSPEGFWELDRLAPTDTGFFTAAHEVGHIFGQPDEYLNTDDFPAYGQPNIGEDQRSAGTPYGLDLDGMMVQNLKPRARYFWDLLLFAQQQKQFADTSTLFVKRGARSFTTTVTPLKGSRVRFPVVTKRDVAIGPFGLCDLFLYETGRDEFTAGAIDPTAAAAPYDGFIMVRVKMAWEVTTTRDFDAVNKLMDRAHASIHRAFNNPRRLAVRARRQGRDVRLRVLFAPRSVCSTFPEGAGSAAYLSGIGPALPQPFVPGDYQARVEEVMNKHGVHVRVRVGEGAPGIVPGGVPRQARVRVDGTFLLVFTSERFDDDVAAMFGHMVGMPTKRTGTGADFVSLVAALSPDITGVVPEILT